MTEASRSAAPSQTPNTFVLKRAVPIPSLNLTVEEYEHPATGAQHLHLSSDSSENVFMVALRTVPEDSTGVAHILEHTALCGSERYPVRDPFFMMLRRSLNTFMNAFTSSDWTAYPFATQNRKDFGNLLDVYLDAVFFSRLDPLDFAQEGHRVEFENDDSSQPLVFKGVVFNEMKGAMSSTPSILWDRLCHELFPSNTYHFNSGGDPEHIPDLSYQELRDFYAEHYHPSNAIFLTFGDMTAAAHQQVFEASVLQRFEALERKIEVALEQPFNAPVKATHPYAVDGEEGIENKTHLVLGWKLGESADLTAMLEAQLVASVLMENSASPLMHYLETTDRGAAPSPLCGLEESMREMVFCCGIEGSEAEHADAFETEVLACIERVAEEGISEDKVDAILRQIELHQREVSGDGMPYGLNLMLRALGAATHYGDAVAALDLEPVIATLRERVQDSAYLPELIRRLLLDNPHRVRLVVAPDAALSASRDAAEAERLAAMKDSLSGEHTAEILDLAARLRERQGQKDDPDILPRVALSDIPSETPSPEPAIEAGVSTHYRYTAGTNGLIYQQWVSPLPALTATELQHLPLVTALMPEVGVGDGLDFGRKGGGAELLPFVLQRPAPIDQPGAQRHRRAVAEEGRGPTGAPGRQRELFQARGVAGRGGHVDELFEAAREAVGLLQQAVRGHAGGAVTRLLERLRQRVRAGREAAEVGVGAVAQRALADHHRDVARQRGGRRGQAVGRPAAALAQAVEGGRRHGGVAVGADPRAHILDRQPEDIRPPRDGLGCGCRCG